jgi:DNA-binding PadR family transcriptional regulator
MAAGPRSTHEAVARTTSVEDARAAAGGAVRPPPGVGDPLLADLRKRGLLALLVLHFLGEGPSYGNQLMERISELTEGLLVLNPNTMYPLLRSLEARGLVRGEWEHPERRSRRFYRLTDAGAAERERLVAEVAPRLDRVATGVALLRDELAR